MKVRCNSGARPASTEPMAADGRSSRNEIDQGATHSAQPVELQRPAEGQGPRRVVSARADGRSLVRYVPRTTSNPGKGESLSGPVRIVVGDDNALFRDSLASLLEASGYKVVGVVATAMGVVGLARECTPDVALVCLDLPGMVEFEISRRLVDELPLIRVVLIADSEQTSDQAKHRELGAHGCLSKNLGTERFLKMLQEAIVRPMRGNQARDSNLFDSPPPIDPLTCRESEVLTLMVEGVTSNRELALHLGISENTVRFHVKHVLEKLYVADRAQAVGFALRCGLVRPTGADS